MDEFPVREVFADDTWERTRSRSGPRNGRDSDSKQDQIPLNRSSL